MPEMPSPQPPPRELAELIFGSNRNVTYFREYTGPQPKRTLRKPIIGPPDRPFPELQVVQRLEERGWMAAWIKSPGQYLSSWEPNGFVQFPPQALKLLKRIDERAGAKARSWDVLAWKDSAPLFLEVQRAGPSAKIRDPQIRWKEAAIAEGVDADSFRLLEWFGGDMRGRVMRLDFYVYDRSDGWAEYRDGALSFSDSGTESICQHYARWGAASPSDLLWLVFARNYDGVTWCAITQKMNRRTPEKEK